MSERTWQFAVHDARGVVHLGSVVYAERQRAFPPLEPPDEFRIVLLASRPRLGGAPEATAICVPGSPAVHPLGKLTKLDLPDRIEALTLAPRRMAAYACGRLLAQTPLPVEPGDVFPVHSDHPRLDRLALAIVEVAAAEGVAPYTALIRHELGLPPGADALAALAARLSPADRTERPPARAPGIVRLRRVLRRLRVHRIPDVTLEQVVEDLRLLRLFAADAPWPDDAMERLLGDVQQPRRRRKPAAIVPLRPARNKR